MHNISAFTACWAEHDRRSDNCSVYGIVGVVTGTPQPEAESEARGQTPKQSPKNGSGCSGASREHRAMSENCTGTRCDLVRKVKSLYNSIGSLEFPVGMYYCNLGRKSEQEKAITTSQLPTRPLGAITGHWPPSRASAWLMQQFSN